MGRPKKDRTFADAAETLDAVKQAERFEDNIIDAPEKKSRAARRRSARNYDLPKDRKCPDCGKVKLRSRQWVVIPDEDIKTCLSCYRKYYS